MNELSTFIFDMFKLFIDNDYLYWVTALMIIPFTIYLLNKFL